MVESITIAYDGVQVTDCESVILVPEIALKEPGYIKTMTAKAEAHSKHEFHAMAQMAYYQYQDDELDISIASAPMEVVRGDEREEIPSGMLIYRDHGGEFHVLIHNHLNRKKMLETTNRYCTRWVRLDI